MIIPTDNYKLYFVVAMKDLKRIWHSDKGKI